MAAGFSIDKASDGISIGLITLTDGKTSAWYARNLADWSHNYFESLEKPLEWDLKLLIICAHGHAGGRSLKGSGDGQHVGVDELSAFIKANMRVDKVLLNVCHGGDSGGVPGESFGNHLSKALGCRVYGAVEAVAGYNEHSLHFYNSHEYHWHRYADGGRADLGVKTLESMLAWVKSRP